MASSSSSSSLLMVVVALLVMAVSMSTAQAQTQTCASNLIPCAQYLNATTKPPNSCCDPIKEAVSKDLQCLCNLYDNPSFLSGLGINVAQALNLPRLCGIPADASACNAQSPSGSNTKPPPEFLRFGRRNDKQKAEKWVFHFQFTKQFSV